MVGESPAPARGRLFDLCSEGRMVRLLGDHGTTVLTYVDGPTLVWVITISATYPDALPAGPSPPRDELAAWIERNMAEEFMPEWVDLALASSTIRLFGELRCVSVPPCAASVLGPPSRVTLMGDAAHAMTTHRGLGANTAFMDARDLAAALGNAGAAEGSFETARERLGGYERVLLRRGFKNVKESLASTRMILMTGWSAKVRNGVLVTIGTAQKMAKRPWTAAAVGGVICLGIALFISHKRN